MTHLLRLRRPRKGVYGVVEEVMLFGMGLVVMVGVMALFNFIEDEMLSTLSDNRLVALNKYVASTAMMLHELNCTSCYVDLEMPSYVGGKTYTVGGSVQKKILIYLNEGALIEEDISVPAEGMVQSTSSHLRVYYESTTSEIKLYGVADY